MNMAKHAAWMMNPNLTEEQVMRLVEADIEREERLLKQAKDNAVRLAQEIGGREGQRAALDYMSYVMPLIICY